MISLCIILWECMNSRAEKMQAAKNLVSCSVNLCFRQIWYLKSPPGIRSMTRKSESLSWNACRIFTMNLCFSLFRRSLSFLIDSLLFLAKMLIEDRSTLPWTSLSWQRTVQSFYLEPCELSQILPFLSRGCISSCSCIFFRK